MFNIICKIIYNIKNHNINLIGRPAASTGKAVTFVVNSPGAFPEK